MDLFSEQVQADLHAANQAAIGLGWCNRLTYLLGCLLLLFHCHPLKLIIIGYMWHNDVDMI